MATRLTRSAARARAALYTPSNPPQDSTLESTATVPRRKSTKTSRGSPSAKGRPTTKSSGSELTAVVLPFVEDHYNPVTIPAILSFSFEEAKAHLIKSDSRFERIFAELSCRPFEQLEAVDPFQTLVTSILGQQISWLAARSIRHRFLRLFDPSLPEKLPLPNEPQPKYTFPSPGRLAGVDVAILRTAGLSSRKAEYVLDLAARFADGRLSTEKLAKATDTELEEMLVAVRGIGKWTVDMFAMFSLRRPNILAVGDLGLQRGLLQWVLSSHLPDQYPLRLSPKKLPKSDSMEAETGAGVVQAGETQATVSTEAGEASSVLPAPAVPTTPRKERDEIDAAMDKADSPSMTQPPTATPQTPPRNKTAVKKAGKGKGKEKEKDEAAIKVVALRATSKVPLPEGITVEVLKSRANGKKAKGGCYLLPSEMDALTQAWAPYRSLGTLNARNHHYELN
ncbi:hypothetical protein FRC12_010352 [Ceratobasidium sp. 428]|nr:hypothetical protein FRC12_010352 [Ceratobasidium sp. 428]